MLTHHVFRCGVLALWLIATSSAVTAASNCKLITVADWPVKPVTGHLVVEGAINGHRVGVMLDSGGITMVFRSAADRLKLTRHTATNYVLFGVGGESYVEATYVDEFKIGELVRKNWEVMVAGERNLGPSIDVILGEDVFHKVDIEFDLPHGRVRLFEPQDCGEVGLGYWAPQGASQVAIETGAWIVVPVQINGQPLQATLDSGAPVSVLDKSAAERLGITVDSPGVMASGRGGGLGANSVESWTAPLQNFAIGNEAINDTVIRFADLYKDTTYRSSYANRIPQKVENLPAMLLGADFLRAHRVLVSHSQRKMYFTYEGGPVFQPRGTPEASREGSARAPSAPEPDKEAAPALK